MQDIILQDTTPEKQCSKCKHLLPATRDFFHVRPEVPDGLRSICKECMHKKYAAQHAKPTGPEGHKQCSKCQQWKPATSEFFEANKECRYGVVATCRDCCKHKALASVAFSQQTKQCTKCNEWKPATLEYFHKRTSRSTGLSSWCRACSLTYKHEHIEQRQQYNKLYYQSHAEQYRQYHQSHKELHRYYKHRLYESRKEEFKQISRNYTKTHKGAISRYKHLYQQAHREERKANHRNYKARVKQVGGVHTARDIQQQYANQKGRCYYCHRKVGKHKGAYHVDHVIPISRGGSNDISNLVIACPTCNNRKYNRLPHEWPEGGRLM